MPQLLLARHFADFVPTERRHLSASHPCRERRKAFSPAQLPRLYLRHNAYVAEIIENRRAGEELVHCIIQRDGSSEILFYTQFGTLEEAKRWAEEELRTYPSSRPEKQGIFAQGSNMRPNRWKIFKPLGP